VNRRAKIIGEEGEKRAVELLKSFGFILSRPDFSGYQRKPRLFYGEEIEADEDIEFEIKTKSERFDGIKYNNGPKFIGHGTDVYQIEKRLRRHMMYGIKQFFLVIQTDGRMYGQWLHRLEDGVKGLTKQGIRVYPLEAFIEIPDIYRGKE